MPSCLICKLKVIQNYCKSPTEHNNPLDKLSLATFVSQPIKTHFKNVDLLVWTAPMVSLCTNPMQAAHELYNYFTPPVTHMQLAIEVPSSGIYSNSHHLVCCKFTVLAKISVIVPTVHDCFCINLNKHVLLQLWGIFGHCECVRTLNRVVKIRIFRDLKDSKIRLGWLWNVEVWEGTCAKNPEGSW